MSKPWVWWVALVVSLGLIPQAAGDEPNAVAGLIGWPLLAVAAVMLVLAYRNRRLQPSE